MLSIIQTLFRPILNGLRKNARRSKPSMVASLECLEDRRMMTVSSWKLSSTGTLTVWTDKHGTSLNVNQTGNNIAVDEPGTELSRLLTYPRNQVRVVEFRGGAGNDYFFNWVDDVVIRAFGAGGNDFLAGGNVGNVLEGGAGNDSLMGGNGDDILRGGSGNDFLFGQWGNDQLLGQDGDDRLDGYEGNDRIWGGNGNDLILGMGGDDQLMGEGGDDLLNGREGNDSLWGGAGNDVLISIDEASGDYTQGDSGSDVAWVDWNWWGSDRVYGATSTDKVQYVGWFANGADRTLDQDRISDPETNPGQTYQTFGSNPLFAKNGPAETDVRQAALGDCYMLAGLAAIAYSNPFAIRQNVVDFNDGTYGVRLGNSFYRVDDDLPVSGTSESPAYAGLGRENSMWVAIVEKAFTHYRTGANSYASIEGGWAVEVNRAFNAPSTGERNIHSYLNATALAKEVNVLWKSREAVTIGFLGQKKERIPGTPLITGHMYAVMSVTYRAGMVTSIVLRNPWGIDGTEVRDGNPDDGLVTVTPTQIYQYAGRVNWGRV